jgi:CHAD domain-containing protein
MASTYSESNNEAAPLLAGAAGASNQNPSTTVAYDAIPREPVVGSNTTAKNKYASATMMKAASSAQQRSKLILVISAIVIIVCIGSLAIPITRSIRHHRQVLRERDSSLATSTETTIFVSNTTTCADGTMHCAVDLSFGELAKNMVSTWYNLSLQQLPLFTETVTPDQVYDARKILLKTRDLMDFFSPLYPNATSTHKPVINHLGKIKKNAKANKSVDWWSKIRHLLNVGYTIVGDFQDLYNAHVLYTEEMMEEKRKRVLAWKHAFAAFQKQHGTTAFHFLSTPSLDAHQWYSHKESHLFWMHVPKSLMPRGADPATESLQRLGSHQLKQSIDYLNVIITYDDVLNEVDHFEYHNLRKQLRSLVDEYDLFKDLMFPNNASIPTLRLARKKLGDINDDWTAYLIYVEKHIHPDEQTRLRSKIKKQWDSFKNWVKEIDFANVLQELIDGMDYSTNTNTTTSTTAIVASNTTKATTTTGKHQ